MEKPVILLRHNGVENSQSRFVIKSNETYASVSDLQPGRHETPVACWTLEYVIDGEVNYLVDQEKNRVVKSGQFMIVNGGRQVMCSLASQQVAGLSICLPEALISPTDHIGHHAEIENQLLEIVWTADLTGLSPAFADLHRRHKHKVDVSENVWMQVVGKLCEHLELESKAIKKIKASKQATRIEIYKRIHAAREYLHRNVTQAITLDDLSKVSHISKYHFLRLFSGVYGVSPFKYLQELRLQRAYELLQTAKYSVTEVAMLMKFSDLSYFSNRFKSHFGFRPSQVNRDKNDQPGEKQKIL